MAMSGAEESRIEQKLDQLCEKIDELKASVNTQAINLQDIFIWRATIEARLTAGVEKMANLEAQVAERVEKKVVLAYLLGASGGTAMLMKLFGG